MVAGEAGCAEVGVSWSRPQVSSVRARFACSGCESAVRRCCGWEAQWRAVVAAALGMGVVGLRPEFQLQGVLVPSVVL